MKVDHTVHSLPGARFSVGLVLGMVLVALAFTSACDVASMEFAGALGGRPDFNLDLLDNGNGTVDLVALDAEESEQYQWAELWRIEGDSPYGTFEVHDTSTTWPVTFSNQPTGYCYRVGIVTETEPDDEGKTSHLISVSTPVIAR
jgi:hypothetical protein